MEVDWKALVFGIGANYAMIGVGVHLMQFTGSFYFLEPVPSDIRSLLVITFTGVGAVVAGYFRSPRLISGALYGIAVTLLGIFVPTILAILAFALVLSLFSGEIGTLYVFGFFSMFFLPVYAVVLGATGVLGGVLGSLLGTWRNS